MNFPFVKYRNFYYLFSGILIFGSLFALIFYRLNLGIDFTGGSIFEIEFRKERISNEEIEKKLADMNLEISSLQPAGEKGLILRMKDIDENTHQEILQRLGNEVEEQRFEFIGPVIGKELRKKTQVFTVLVLLAIVLYIAISFRRASKPVSSFHYGVVAALVDIAIYKTIKS